MRRNAGALWTTQLQRGFGGDGWIWISERFLQMDIRLSSSCKDGMALRTV